MSDLVLGRYEGPRHTSKCSSGKWDDNCWCSGSHALKELEKYKEEKRVRDEEAREARVILGIEAPEKK